VKWYDRSCSLITVPVNYRCAASSRISQVPLNIDLLNGSNSVLLLSSVGSHGQLGQSIPGVSFFDFDEVHEDVQFSFQPSELKKAIRALIWILQKRIKNKAALTTLAQIHQDMRTVEELVWILNNFFNVYNKFVEIADYQQLFQDLLLWNSTSVSKKIINI